MLNIAAWLIAGSDLGWVIIFIRAIPNRSRLGLLNLVIGGTGAVLAGTIVPPLLGLGGIVDTDLNLPRFVMASLASLMLLTHLNLARYRLQRLCTIRLARGIKRLREAPGMGPRLNLT